MTKVLFKNYTRCSLRKFNRKKESGYGNSVFKFSSLVYLNFRPNKYKLYFKKNDVALRTFENFKVQLMGDRKSVKLLFYECILETGL